MKESHNKGVANRVDPESCTWAREGSGEALTGAGVGRVLSLENNRFWSADVLGLGGRQHRVHRYRKAYWGSTWSENPSMYRSIRRNLRGLAFLLGHEEPEEREGKSKDMSPR